MAVIETLEAGSQNGSIPQEGFVPNFGSSEELTQGHQKKADFCQDTSYYPRDGSPELGALEGRLALLNGVEREQLVAYGFGMQAVTDAIDVGAYHNSKSPTIVAGNGMYTQNRKYVLGEYAERRGSSVKFSATGDSEDFCRSIDTVRPDLIIAETISNAPTTEVLDVDALLDTVRSFDVQPVIILDNTLPLSTGLDLSDKFLPTDNVIVVESGTKSALRNGSGLGIAHTENEELLFRLRDYRRTRGTIIEPKHAEEKLDLIVEDREAYDERNKRVFRNTAAIAQLIFAANEAGAPTRSWGRHLNISHPGLPNHANHEYYTEQYPDHGSPVIYVQTADKEVTKEGLTDAFYEHPGVSEHMAIRQSFGFDLAGIQHDRFDGMVRTIRIAGGAETDVEALGSLLISAIEEIE